MVRGIAAHLATPGLAVLLLTLVPQIYAADAAERDAQQIERSRMEAEREVQASRPLFTTANLGEREFAAELRGLISNASSERWINRSNDREVG